MKYMLLAYSPESAWTQEEWQACTVESCKICEELEAIGQFIAAAPLESVANAASVRVRNTETIVTDGPFAETTEQLGGFFLINVPDLDTAINVAKRLPSCKKGTVEIRPVHELAGVPKTRFDAPIPADMGRYMLLCYDNEMYWQQAGPAALNEAQAEAAANTQHLAKLGQFVAASPLQSVATATSVRVRKNELLITDGPFAETREFLGGYYLIDVRDLNDAINIAARHPGARSATVEVRRLVDLDKIQNK